MFHIITPLISRVIAVMFSAFIGLIVGVSTKPVTGFIVFSGVLLWFFSGVLTKNLPYSIPFVRNLKTFNGVVKSVRHSIDTQGSEDSITTYQVAAFNLDGIPVRLSMRESIFIAEGDDLVVCGLYRRGILTGLAYKNLSRNNVIQRAQAGGYIFFGILFGFFGLYALASPEDLKVAGWLLAFVSVGIIRIGTSIFRAENVVRYS